MVVITQLLSPEELQKLSVVDLEILKLNAWRALAQDVPDHVGSEFQAKTEFRLRHGADIDDPEVRERVDRVVGETFEELTRRQG